MTSFLAGGQDFLWHPGWSHEIYCSLLEPGWIAGVHIRPTVPVLMRRWQGTRLLFKHPPFQGRRVFWKDPVKELALRTPAGPSALHSQFQSSLSQQLSPPAYQPTYTLHPWQVANPLFSRKWFCLTRGGIQGCFSVVEPRYGVQKVPSSVQSISSLMKAAVKHLRPRF